MRLRGRSEVSRVFTLVGDEAVRGSESFRALADRHVRILEAYRAGNFTTAVLLLRVAQGSAPPRQAAMYAEFERRCDALARSKPESWTPVTLLQHCRAAR